MFLNLLTFPPKGGGDVLGLSPSFLESTGLFGGGGRDQDSRSRSSSGERSGSPKSLSLLNTKRLFANKGRGKEKPTGAAPPAQPRGGRKVKRTFCISSGQQRKQPGSKVWRRRNADRTHRDGSKQTPPVIVVQKPDSVEGEEAEDENRKEARETKLRVLMVESNKKTSEKKPAPGAMVTRKKCRDMSHIRAKWLLGLSLTMVR